MRSIIFVSASLLFLTIFSSAQEIDSVKTYSLSQITVFGKKYSIARSEFPVEKDNLSSVLELGGFNIIRKGVFLAQDIYADGLKRGDYSIVVDGERYHNACPMRMDAPITRINPIEVETIELVKSSANLHSSLGGTVAINRSIPKPDFNFSGSMTKVFGKSNENDIALSAEKFENRISLRYNDGIPYETGNNKSFKDLYGYKNSSKYHFGEASLFGVFGDWKYSASFMYTDNVTFPYLQMDERKSLVYNGSLSYDDFKIYFNYTDHLMNNDLRVSTMFMETHAKNLTIGIKSNSMEAYYRYWNADNEMMMSNGTMKIYNNILPKINLYSANLFHGLQFEGFNFTGKVGFAFYNLGNKDILNFYSNVFGDVKDKRFIPIAGFSVSRSFLISNEFSLSSMLDFAAEAPEAEALYITVKRMMGKPYWSGNPNLDQPLRTTIRTNLSFKVLNSEFFFSYISNYVYLASKKGGMQNYQTFGNVNALLAGFSLSADFDFIESRLTYTYGENADTKSPLSEILPMQVITKVSLPELYNMFLYFRHTYENAQKRVDPSVKETAGSTWNRIDAGLNWNYKPMIFTVEAENILNSNYSKHLSYVRDPFASGFRIFEPGLTFRVNIRYYY